MLNILILTTAEPRGPTAPGPSPRLKKSCDQQTLQIYTIRTLTSLDNPHSLQLPRISTRPQGAKSGS